MTDINVTKFFATVEPFDFARSMAEAGQNAGRDSWNNAKREAAESPLLTTEAHLDALRQWAKETGAWDETERAAWTADDCNALFIQIISGDYRELENLYADDNGEIDWARAQEMAESGVVSGNLYRADDGNLYYYLGS